MGPFGFKEDGRRPQVVGVGWGPWGGPGFRGRRRDRSGVGGGSRVEMRVAGGGDGWAGLAGVVGVGVVGGFGAFGSVVAGATAGAVVLIGAAIVPDATGPEHRPAPRQTAKRDRGRPTQWDRRPAPAGLLVAMLMCIIELDAGHRGSGWKKRCWRRLGCRNGHRCWAGRRHRCVRGGIRTERLAAIQYHPSSNMFGRV
jgi:hypothetical protein